MTLSPGPGVFSASAPLPPSLTSFFESQPRLPGLPIVPLEDDCALETNFTSAANEVASAESDAQNLIASILTCRSQMRLTYCDVIAALEAVPIGSSNSEYLALPFPEGSAGAVPIELRESVCDVYVQQVLYQLPTWIDWITLGLADCNAAHGALIDQLAAVPATMTQVEKDRAFALADARFEWAERSLTDATERLALIQALKAEMTLAAVHSSCLDCPGSGLTFLPSSAISLGADSGVLQELADAFHAAATTASEPDDATRFQAIGDQMAGTPASRVLQLSYPSGRAVGDYFVALRSDGVADDGFSPLAVVMSARAGGPNINTRAQLIVLDGWHAFHDTLAPGPRPDDEDYDDDRLRDIYETGSGGFTSRTDTGTDPNRPDTDGDLYFDSTEIASGSNTNDSTSVPEGEVGAPIGAMGLYGTLLLGVGLGASILLLRRA